MQRNLLSLAACAWLLAMVAVPAAGQEPPRPVRAFEVQGKGTRSELVGRTLVVTGVVTADLVATDVAGFALQDPVGDGDEDTSDGLFVRTGAAGADVAVGALVLVTGTVAESYGQTELRASSVVKGGTADVPAPALLAPPPDPEQAVVYLEAREGMRAALAPSVAVAATNGFGDAYVLPADAGVERVLRGDREGRKLGLRDPAGWLAIDTGDRVNGAMGVLLYSYGQFVVALDGSAPPLVVPGGRLPDQAAPPGPGEISVATYNLSNLFDPEDAPGKSDPRPSAQRYAADLTVRARSIAEGLGGPDVVAVQEVENVSVLRDVAAEAALVGARYSAALVEGPDGRGIDVGFLYRQDRLELRRLAQHQACTTADVGDALGPCLMPDGSTGTVLYGRPPLEGRFRVRTSGQTFTVVVNHFKSMSGDDDTGGTARVEMSWHNLTLLRRIGADRGAGPIFLVGDLNDVEDSAALRVLAASGLVVDLHDGVERRLRYTYSYGGEYQVLDYILAPPGLTPLAFGPVHCNTDVAAVSDAAFGPQARRASDHDPILVRVALSQLGAPAAYLPAALRRAAVGRTAPPHGSPTPTPSAQNPPTPSPAPTPDVRRPARTPLRIVGLLADGSGSAEPDEYLAFVNVSADAVDLTGWQVVSVRGDQRFTFPTGFTVTGGQACRLYTNERYPEHCDLTWGRAQPVWHNAGDKAEILDATGNLVDWWCYGDMADQCPDVAPEPPPGSMDS